MDTYSKFRMVEKISNEIFRPCPELVLKHNVRLGNKNQCREKMLFHSEFDYSSPNYVDVNKLKMIKLKYQSYLSLEEVNKDWTSKQTLLIDIRNIYIYRKFFKKIYKWFVKKKYEDMYFYEDNILKISMKYKDLKERISINSNSVIEIRPYVYEYGDSTLSEGILMCINSHNTCIKMSFKNFQTLYYIIKEFDLYTAGLGLINYLGRPDFDTNCGAATTPTNTNYFSSKFTKSIDSNGNQIDKNFFNKVK